MPATHTHTHRYICFIVGVVVAVRVSPLSRALFIKYASLGTPSATTVCHLSHARLRILSPSLSLPFRGQVQLPCHSAHSGILRKAVLHADSSVDVPSILSVHCGRLCAHLQHCCCHSLYRVRFACLSTSLLQCGSYQRHTHTLLISHSQVHHCMGGRCIGRRLRGASPVSSCALVVGISPKQRASAVVVTTTKYPLVCHDTMVVVELLHAFHALQGAL